MENGLFFKCQFGKEVKSSFALWGKKNRESFEHYSVGDSSAHFPSPQFWAFDVVFHVSQNPTHHRECMPHVHMLKGLWWLSLLIGREGLGCQLSFKDRMPAASSNGGKKAVLQHFIFWYVVFTLQTFHWMLGIPEIQNKVPVLYQLITGQVLKCLHCRSRILQDSWQL